MEGCPVNIRPTLAVGYDIVLPVDPAIYAISEDAAGRAYAFDMADARGALGEAIQAVLEHPRDADRVEIEPGYIRVRIAPSEPITPKAVVETLQSIPETYNQHNATASDLDGFAFDHRYYIGTYHPEDAPAQEPFLDTYGPGEDAPEYDGAIFTYDDYDADDAAPMADRQLRYDIVLPFDAEIYEPATAIGGYDTPAVRWDADGVEEALQITAEDVPAWPGTARNLLQIAVYPEYARLEYRSGSMTKGPERLVERTIPAFLSYNRYRGVDEERSTGGRQERHPPISFTADVYVAGVATDRSAEEYIDEHDLEAIDTDPMQDADPEPDTGEGDPDEGFWSSVVSR